MITYYREFPQTRLKMLTDSPLGQPTLYIEKYSADLLFPISRSLGRDKIGLIKNLPFHGVDLWNGYELSWLDLKGKPLIALIVLEYAAESANIVESKSLKLYFNSFNQTHFDCMESVKMVIQSDLTKVIGLPVSVNLYSPNQFVENILIEFDGTCLDNLDIETNCYLVDPSLLKNESEEYVEETLYSNLLKSNCLATGQPDWGSILIRYKGPKINEKGLLKYIISYRNHQGFHEHCVEQIFNDILNRCNPSKLTVFARYTRRGGLDINPFRSNFENAPKNLRQMRQ